MVAAALVGADRRGAAGAREVLERAAVLAVRRRAGRLARRVRAPGEAAPAERGRPAGAAAARRLRALLDGAPLGGRRILEEWVRAAASRELVVPGWALPEMLDLGAADRSLRRHVAVVAGRRGRWLAGLNPAWAWLLDEEGEGTGSWETGGRGDRRALLRRLRASDPARARETLASTWDRETAEDRAAFLAVLAESPGPGDEALLEHALDDRRREVRQAAADLLTRLPGADLGRRMAERALRCLRVEDGRLVAEPPRECDQAMERDGVRRRPPPGVGERGWWLEQTIARTPLDVWAGRLGATPEEIAGLPADVWGGFVRAGWVRAAILRRDAAWARALLGREPSGDLLALLPHGEAMERAARLVGGRPLDGELIMLLGALPGPWTGPLPAAVLDKIVTTSRHQPWNLSELCGLAAERFDPATGLGEHAGRPIDDLRALAETLRFRHEMLKELA
ncbi:hypothetical protein D5H75_06500 [Bailinhaonella thermotolerans]|uniref:Uncharacterized protein n=1 Tax=Bailinhaonella thermotolerans TaxID=1070861 RepID=A0A3A4AWI0_9ACTN|nr:hypothetical protein D5H75_06500 [Bailinhaonella thermotolerans]